MTAPRLPTFFIPHGGGPWHVMEGDWGPEGVWRALNEHLSGLIASLQQAPRAILVVTAHWESAQPSLSAADAPGLLYDYSGFPSHTYDLHYPVAGSLIVARRIQDLLAEAGLPATLDTVRGLDHGVFVPLMVMRPQADIPVVALSLVRGLDPATHLALGAALAPLRDEGVLIVASGMSYHNLRDFFGASSAAQEAAKRFDDWLSETIVSEPGQRRARLIAWASAPGARACHPREEHLLPLMVAVGAAGEEAGVRDFSDRVFDLAHSGFRFG